jgi:large subunit ribosomal protein L4
MAKASYYKADGKKGRARELPEALFGGAVNEPVLHLVVKAQLANRRQGTAAAKTRAEVSGGGRKPWRQKGTGRARQGTIRAPHWTGGGIAFPPQAHSWRQGIPKKVKAVARQSALSARAADDRVILIDQLAFDEPSTRRLVKYLKGIGVEGKALVLTHGNSDAVVLSARNAPELIVRPFGGESVYDILWARTIVIERPALDESAGPEAEEETDA